MNRWMMLGFAAVLVGGFFVLFFQVATTQAQEKKPKEIRWEYKVVSKTLLETSLRGDEAEFNRLGGEGWEMCGTVSPTSGRPILTITYIFKRVKTDPRTSSRLSRMFARTFDVRIIEDRGWAVVEQNAAWGSGIYGCDPEQVLEVLRVASAG